MSAGAVSTRVWLLRHAETSGPDVYHGYESDADLSPLGYRQAEAIAPVIAARRPEVIYSSGMLRARRTAEPIARACGLPLLIERELHERRMGAMVGTPAQPGLGIAPDTLRRWIDGDTAYAPEGAESFDDLRRRVLGAWDRMIAAHAGRSLVVVSHGNVCRVLLLSLIPGRTIADWANLGRIPNASISELVGTGRDWRALTVAELPPEVRELGKMGSR
jgi:broad specificity phosphatase PhoE